MAAIHKVIYIEDEKKWRDTVQDELGRDGRDLWVIPLGDGEKALEYIKGNPRIDASLIDYYLLVEGSDEEQNLQGYDLCREIEKIRPGLPQFLLSEYPEREAQRKQDYYLINDKIREMLNRCGLPWDHYLQKKKFELMDFDDMARRIHEAIFDSVRKVFRNNLKKYYPEYKGLKSRRDWPQTDQEISQEAEEWIERFEKNDQEITGLSLGQFRPLRGDRALRNALVARRMVIGMVAKHGGSLFKAQVLFNDGWRRSVLQADVIPVNDETVFNNQGGFKKQCTQSYGLNTAMVRDQWGLLPEEKEWFDQYRKKVQLLK